MSALTCSIYKKIGDLELTTVHSIIGKKYCFDVFVITDENDEPKEHVILHLYSNDTAIFDFYSSTTKFIITDSNGMVLTDTTLVKQVL